MLKNAQRPSTTLTNGLSLLTFEVPVLFSTIPLRFFGSRRFIQESAKSADQVGQSSIPSSFLTVPFAEEPKKGRRVDRFTPPPPSL